MPTGRKRRTGGFTLVELMVTVAVSAIALVLAVPAWNTIVEKRQVTAAAEGIASLLSLAQGEAIKRNEAVMVSWYSPGSYGSGWCVGASSPPKATPCNCRPGEEQVAEDALNFCSVGASGKNEADGTPYRLWQTDFAPAAFELDAVPAEGGFSFDPVRGIMGVFTSDGDRVAILDDDYLFSLQSSSGSGGKRNFALQIKVNITGRVTICTDDGRKAIIGGYPAC